MRLPTALLLALILLLPTTPAGAEEVEDAAARARKAHAANDAAALARVANDDSADAWVVTEWLLGAGDVEVARALAELRRPVERKALVDYVAWRASHPVRPEVAAALQEAASVSDRKAFLERIEPLLESGRGVSHVRLAELRTAIVDSLGGGPGPVGKAMLASATAADAIGWHVRAFHSYRAAFQRLHAVNEAESMEAAAEALLRLAAASESKAEGFVAHQMEAFRLHQGHHPEDALEHAHRSLEFAQSPLERRNALRVVIMLNIRLGHDHVVLRELEKLIALDHELGDTDGAMLSETQLARYEAQLGRSARAMARIERVLAYMKEHGVAAELYGTHLQAAQIRRALGDPERSLEHIRQARAEAARAREVGDGGHIEPYQLDNMEALALSSLERYAEAAVLSRKVAEGRADAPRAMRLYDRLSLAINLAYLGEHSEAATFFGQAKALLGPDLEAHIRARFHAVHASGLILAGKYDDAFREAEVAEKISRDARFTEFRRSSLGVIGRVWYERGDMRRAATAFDAMLRLLLTRSAMLPDRAGARFRSNAATRQEHLSIYYGIEAAARTGDPAVLFQMTERLSAVALRSRLDTMDVAASLTPALRETELALEEAETQAVRRFRSAEEGEARTDALKALGTVREELDRHRERMRAEQATAAQVIDPAIDSLAHTQRRLAPGESIVVYAEGVEHLWAIVADRKVARVVKVGRRDAVSALLEGVVLEDPQSPWKATVEELRKALVAPLTLTTKVKRLLVVPSGDLAFVPFSALVGSRECSLLPSATAGRLLEAQPAGGEGTLAVGDPASADGRRLPGSRKEAEAVGDVVLVGSQATEAKIEEVLASRPRWRAVHVGCHGLIDPFHPLRSALALTPDDDDDGLWTVSELLRTRIATDLAVLGACSTGRGRSFNQEGVLGFVHAFFVAGARQVVVSLWDVDDEAASALLGRFHEEWKPGVSAATALARAQAWVRAQPRFAHPAYWASWQLWGPR